MNTENRYRISGKTAMDRLSQLQQSSPRLADDDIAIVRYLAEEAINDGNPSLADKLLQTLARLTVASDTSAEKHGDLIPRNRLIEIATQMMDLICDCFSDCDSYNDRIDNLVARLPELLETSNV